MLNVLIAPIAVLAFGLSWGPNHGHHASNHYSGHYYDDAIVVFTDAGFRGEALITDEPIRNLNRYGFNNEISSFFVPDGFVATFYGKPGFRGKRFTVEGPHRVRRIDCAWDERISSVKVVRTDCDVRPHRPAKVRRGDGRRNLKPGRVRR